MILEFKFHFLKFLNFEEKSFYQYLRIVVTVGKEILTSEYEKKISWRKAIPTRDTAIIIHRFPNRSNWTILYRYHLQRCMTIFHLPLQRENIQRGEKKTHQSTCQNFQFPKRTASPALWRSLVERRYFHINTANYCHPSRGITCYRLTEIKGYWQVWVKENKRKVKKKNQDKWKNHFRKGILL